MTTAADDRTGTVWVRRSWNGSDGARLAIRELKQLHWSDVSGGHGARSPRRMLHGYVWCDQVLEGELGHSCLHGPPPHRVKVCIVAKDNPKPLVAELKSIATENDRRRRGIA